MKRLTGTVGLNPEVISESVASYLTANPISADEPELAVHIASSTPHPAYDNDMNLDIYLENGLA